jgi:hypothetical protein
MNKIINKFNFDEKLKDERLHYTDTDSLHMKDRVF